MHCLKGMSIALGPQRTCRICNGISRVALRPTRRPVSMRSIVRSFEALRAQSAEMQSPAKACEVVTVDLG